MMTLFLVLGSLASIIIMLALVMMYAIKGGKAGIAMPEATFGTAGKKVLVAYATKAGSTGEAAMVIGKTIAAQGARVDVKPIAKVGALTGYEAFVLGAAIRGGNPTSEYVGFVRNHANVLGEKPTSVYLLCMTLSKDTAENRQTVEKYFDAVRKYLRPKTEGYFAGRMNYSLLNPLARIAARDMVKVPEGDFRNPSAMEQWAVDSFKLF
jgi:menaquinone-dependent protoporphyrinogen oxidase